MGWGVRRVVISLALCISCSSKSSSPPALLDDPPSHPDGAGPTVPFPPAGSPTFAIAVGATVDVSPGTRAGYALTSTAPGTYQLRWTGDASVTGDGFKQFYGTIWTSGHFTALTPGCENQACPLESGDIVSGVAMVAGGQRIDWDTFASTGWDGFGFQTDAEPVYFDVLVDGKRRPDLFVYPSPPSGAPASPSASPFSISPAP